MDDRTLGYYIFRGCSYICAVFAIVSLVTWNVAGACGWTISGAILKMISKVLLKRNS